MAKLEPDVEYLEYYLDSSDATLSQNSQVSKLNWPLYNLVVPLQNVQSFKVLEAQLPISYCVTAGASFVIRMYAAYTTTTGSSTSITINLPTTGNPSGAQIATYISGILAASPPNLAGWLDTGHQTYLVCTFIPAASSATGLPYFSFDTNTHSYGNVGEKNQDFQIIVSSQRTEDIMGFNTGTTNCINFGVAGSGNSMARKSLLSTRPTLITGSPYLYISSNAIGNNCKTFLPQGAALLSGGVSSPQIAKVPVSNAVQGQWLAYADNTQGWFDVDNMATVSQIDLYCQLGNYGGYLDFQGLPFSIKLGVLVKRDVQTGASGNSTLVKPFAMMR
jgi:hypothetical protein